MRAVIVKLGVFLAGLLVMVAPASAQRKPPYWVSISANASEARMRTGPGKQFPTSWLFQRPRLPLKVIAIYQEWRKVEDPGGTQGWMQATLLSPQRTGMIRDTISPMRAAPRAEADIIFRAAPGVVGKLSECGKGWCLFDVNGQMGYVEAPQLWGVDAAELAR